MPYLFIGENSSQKQELIAGLKDKFLSAQDSSRFDYEALYGHKLDPKDLKKALISLPAISSKRLIFIHDADKLSEHCKEILVEFFNSKPGHAEVIIECYSISDKDGLWAEIRRQSKVHETPKAAAENVFDMTRKMLGGRTAEALKSLNNLYEAGQHPLQIMGGVVWAWSNERGRVSSEKFEEGLRELQEADLNIKRSRLPAEQAVEVLVVKLAGLRK